jgi:hypothetical protein
MSEDLHMGTTGTPPLPNGLSSTELEMLKLRTNYAWNVWEFAGRQRVSMFNYFLLITGILVNGCLLALKENIRGALPAICLLEVFQCVAFFMIDVRNRKLLYRADDLLGQLERDYLFEALSYKDSGPLTRRDNEEREHRWLRICRMKYWMRGT